jgi:hypothetical protein
MTRVTSARFAPVSTLEIGQEKSVKAVPKSDQVEAKKLHKIEAPARANVRGTGDQTIALRTDKKQNTPEVEALLALYAEGSKPVSRPQERLLHWVAFIDGKLKLAGSASEVVDVAVKEDLRRRVFLLEGLLKLYRGTISKDIDHGFDAAKKLEDGLGDYTYAVSMTKTASEKGAPAEVVAYFKGEEAAARQKLESDMTAQWMPNENGKIPGIKKLVHAIRKGEFEKYKNDREYLQKAIAHEIKDVEESDYDMGDLENGLHELRRQLRWVPVYAESTAGLFQLDDTKDPVAAYKAMKDSELASSKFVRLPSAEREKAPVQVSKSLYVSNMDYVLKLGAIKDMGEQIHGMARAYLALGTAKDEKDATRLALQLLGLDASSADFSAQGTKIYQELQERKLLRALRHDIKEQ